MNLATILDGHADDAVAIVSRGEPTSYGRLCQQVAELRGGLVRAGVQPGDRVAIAAGNNWFFVAPALAALGAGAVLVPLNPTSPPAEFQAQLAGVRPRFAVVGPTGRGGFAAVDWAGAGVEAVFVPGGVDLPGATPLDGLLGGETVPTVDRAADDLALLVFTSGTAGSPKAAMLSHGNLLANLDQLQRAPGRAVHPDDVVLGVLPLFHIFGFTVGLALTLAAGACVVLVERFDPVSALDTIRDRAVTLIAGAPPMFAAWAALPSGEDNPMRSVRLAVSGGAPLSPEVAEAFARRFGIPVWEGYGLTEAAPVVTSSVAAGAPRAGSIGTPLPGVEVRLVDEEGEDALVGDPGEIWVRGPNVFKGYWEDDAATRSVLTDDGWLRTGDVAVADDDGYLRIVDRAKDLIIVSGFNVYPAEVEEALLEHPGIAQVAVVGVPHPHSGETVKAFVVPEPGRGLEEDDVIEFCAHRLARYKCPTKVTFVPALPTGAGGKLLRRQLR